MVRVKSLFDAVEPDDGQRLWVEAIGLTADLQAWCSVDHVLTQFGPPIDLWRWFETHPQGYDYFRGKYHTSLDKNPDRAALVELAATSRKKPFTLLHQNDDDEHNAATALQEYLAELEAYAPPE